MGKIDLAGQLGDARARVAAPTPPLGRAVANEAAPKSPPPVRAAAKFARLTRKETRVREDQYVALTQLARALMRRRTDRWERITENTLVRVAIDLLLANADQLVGDSENELLQSVTSERTHSRTLGVPNSAAAGAPDSAAAGAPDSATSGVPRAGASAVDIATRGLT